MSSDQRCCPCCGNDHCDGNPCRIECVGACKFKRTPLSKKLLEWLIGGFLGALASILVGVLILIILGPGDGGAEERLAGGFLAQVEARFKGGLERVWPEPDYRKIATAVADELERRGCAECREKTDGGSGTGSHPVKDPIVIEAAPVPAPLAVLYFPESSVYVTPGRWGSCDRNGYRFTYPIFGKKSIKDPVRNLDVDEWPYVDLGFFNLDQFHPSAVDANGCSTALVSRVWRDRGLNNPSPANDNPDREDGSAPYVYFYSAPRGGADEMAAHLTFLRATGGIIGAPASISIKMVVRDGRPVTSRDDIIDLVEKIRFHPMLALPAGPVRVKADLVAMPTAGVVELVLEDGVDELFLPQLNRVFTTKSSIVWSGPGPAPAVTNVSSVSGHYLVEVNTRLEPVDIMKVDTQVLTND